VAILLGPGPFPVDMIGSGQRVSNTSPPSVALLSFAAAQTGFLLLLEPAGARLLRRPRWWRHVQRLNAFVLTVYLWHMTPVIIVAVTLFATGVFPQPAVGSSQWWELRPAWFAVLTAILIPLTILVSWAERSVLRIPIASGQRDDGARSLWIWHEF